MALICIKFQKKWHGFANVTPECFIFAFECGKMPEFFTICVGLLRNYIILRELNKYTEILTSNSTKMAWICQYYTRICFRFALECGKMPVFSIKYARLQHNYINMHELNQNIAKFVGSHKKWHDLTIILPKYFTICIRIQQDARNFHLFYKIAAKSHDYT